MAFTEPLTVELSHAICRFNPIDMGSVVELPENAKIEDFSKTDSPVNSVSTFLMLQKTYLSKFPDMPIMNLMDIGVCDKWFCNCMINMIPLKLCFRLILNYNVFDNLSTRAPKKTEDKSPNIKILD